MRRPTLADIRNSSLGQSVGLCSGNLSAVASAVNEAQERLLMDPMQPDEGWWGGWVKMVFTVATPVACGRYGYITAPQDIARIIVMDICQTPVRIRNGFYEYLEFGIGLQPNQVGPCCTNTLPGLTFAQAACGQISAAYERDNVATLLDLNAGPQIIRIYPSNPADVGKRLVIQGADQNGKTVYAVDPTTQKSVLGETVYLDSPFVDTVNQFTKITGILKDQTLDPVTIFQVVAATGTESALSSMEPQENTAAYRRYLVNGLPYQCCNQPFGQVQVTAQCKLDFVPVQSDRDYLIIPNVPALIEEVQAIRYSHQDSEASAKLETKHHLKALALLNGQLDAYLGKVNTAINVPIFGSDRLRQQPM